MKHVRKPWMIRAALGSMVVGVILIAWTALWIWLYGYTAGAAPEWMLAKVLRGGWNILGLVVFMGYMVSGAFLGFGCVEAIFKVLRIPSDAFAERAESNDFPFNRRKPSPRALTQPGQAGFVDTALERLETFSRSPLSPPPRKMNPD
jgi:hypothetical protein